MGRRSANARIGIRQAAAECRHSRRADFDQAGRRLATDVRILILQCGAQNRNLFRAAFPP